MDKNADQKPGKLGILAGRGNLPWLAAREALQAGEDVRIFHYAREEPPPDLKSITQPVILMKIFSSALSAMKKAGVSRVLLLGKATRDDMYGASLFAVDWRVLFILARAVNQSDYTIFSSFARKFDEAGVRIIPQDSYLSGCFLPFGRYGKKCNRRELEDVVFGLFHAQDLNRLDIGQTAVVGKKAVLAVECAEGTDRCIRRGGELFHKKGAVVCKTAKKNHDRRFDIPTVGRETLKSMSESGCRVLALESRSTLIVSPAEFIAEAKKLGITILALDPDKTDENSLKKINARAARLK